MKVAVIGAGAMGRHHIRIYADMAGVELVAVADSNHQAAHALTRRFGGQPYQDFQQMLDQEKPDAVTVAVPTIYHREVALQVIRRGINVLIEKPIAYSVAEGTEIIEAAEAAGVCLMVGHVERFNPAVIQLKERVQRGELGRVFQMDARRQGPFPARLTDVGVVIDLAVHDLDVMMYISGSGILRVFAETERRIHSTFEDLVTAVMRLHDGTVGTLATNWLTPTKIRELHVTGERGMFRVDYLTQDLYFFQNATASGDVWETLRALRGVSEGSMVRHVVRKIEPLYAEIESFLAAVRGEHPVAITGQHGLDALEAAHAIAVSGLEERVVSLGSKVPERST